MVGPGPGKLAMGSSELNQILAEGQRRAAAGEQRGDPRMGGSKQKAVVLGSKPASAPTKVTTLTGATGKGGAKLMRKTKKANANVGSGASKAAKLSKKNLPY